MDFGSYAGYGIPYKVVSATTPRSTVIFDYDDESDHVGYPIPASPLDRGRLGRHILMVDKDACRLYELFAARSRASPGRRAAGRPGTSLERAPTAGWTSADAAGLPILPGLVRYDEVAAGAIATPCGSRRTARGRPTSTRPATRRASRARRRCPPMGLRVRLKATFDTAGCRRRRGSSPRPSSATG